MFIRAPKILNVKNNVKILARDKKTNDIAIVEQYDSQTGQYFLGATCHPEMSTSKLSEYFLRKILLHTKI
jgi:glutamine amidotransferase PdxT